MKVLKYFLLLLFFLISFSIFSQKDTTKLIKTTSDTIVNKQIGTLIDTSTFKPVPWKAFVLSAICPGLGQAYNRKYWKIPIVYSILGATVFWADFNNRNYKRFTKAYLYMTDDLKSTVSEFGVGYTEENLLFYKKRYRRNRDLSIILGVVFYALNMVDANVDAHLYDYDIGDDLSLKVEPIIIPITDKNQTIGVQLSLRF